MRATKLQNKQTSNSLYRLSCHAGWNMLEQARSSFFACDLTTAARLLKDAVCLAAIHNDNTLLIESAILWRECRMRSGCPELAENCFDLARQYQPS